MGTWGVGLFDDDLAADVKNAFLALHEQGFSPEAATEKILSQFSSSIEDDDERSVVFLALAQSQIDKHELEPNIKNEAKKILENGEAMRRWSDASSEDQTRRKEILVQLANTLE